jgi:hypothetical protein
MKKWHVLFEDDRQGPEVLEAEDPAQISRRVHSAVSTGEVEGRKVLGMWITQRKGKQVNVLMVHGRAPAYIDRLYRRSQPPRYAPQNRLFLSR